jgi:predicted dehydrogenase
MLDTTWHMVREAATAARYFTRPSYVISSSSLQENARKLSWWDKSASCGPVVEQATHFVDLIRYIAGLDNPVRSDSVRAIAVEHDEEAGSLSKQQFDEGGIPPDQRVPRVTTAMWKHKRVSEWHFFGLW